MKTITKNLEWAARILSLIILLQSCTVYNSATTSVDEAIMSNDKVKVDAPEANSYKFLKIIRMDNEIYGVAKKKSYTSKKLQAQIVDTSYEGKYNLIKLTRDDLESVHLKNKGASLALTIGIPVILVGALVIAVATADIGPSFGTY
jgi:hypothetical protein